MIYTVTLNPALDKTVTISSFQIGEVNRIASVRMDPGGKGLNVSKGIENLGGQSHAFAALGGSTGEEIRKMLQNHRFALEVIPAEGNTRTNLKVIDPVLHTNTDINEPGCGMKNTDLRAFLSKLDQVLNPTDILVLSGSVPANVGKDIYARLTAAASSHGVKVFVDAEKHLLEPALAEGPYLVKPNIHELAAFAGRTLTTETEVREAAGELLQAGAHYVLVSMGGDGAVLYAENGEIWSAKVPKVPVVSTVGAGDSMVAAFAYGTDAGMSVAECVRLAAAAGTAAVTCAGSNAPERKQVMDVYQQVKIEKVQ